jgi:hypothetical protein
MLIRHAEKPPDAGPPPYGIDANGEHDKHSLTARGWQRAGALVPFFREAWMRAIETPDAVYAAKVGDEAVMVDGHDVSKSLRPQQTVTPLVYAIDPEKGLQTPFAVGEEIDLARHIAAHEHGVVLVAWEHHHVPDIARVFCPGAPAHWENGRFDGVWVLTRTADDTYEFEHVNQALLSGDLPATVTGRG